MKTSNIMKKKRLTILILKFKCFALNHLQSGGNHKCSFVNYLDMGESLISMKMRNQEK
jgi:hypothetical protein